MPSTLSDSDMSFESEDSEIYVIAQRSEASLSSSEDEPAAYADDPKADAEWSAKYQKEVEADLKLERERKDRLEGKVKLRVRFFKINPIADS